jgi:Ca-activated chloride channel family protein
MQWEKLESSFRALESLLRSLRPADQFNVLLYNDAVTPLGPAPVAATPEAVEKALMFLRESRLRGGTNLQAVLDAALAQTFSNDPYLVILGDLGSTRGILANGKLAEWYATKWKQIAEPRRPRPTSSPRATTRICRWAACSRAITASSNGSAPPNRSISS